MSNISFIRTVVTTAIVLGWGAGAVTAQTATGTFDVTITIQADCEITSTETLNFGTEGVLASEVLSTADVVVTCTTGTAYDVGLDEGIGAGATITTRKMTAGADTIDYEMYRDTSRTLNWGNTPTVDTASDTGTGTAQTQTVYGRVPPQTTPGPATYTDTVTVTVTF